MCLHSWNWCDFTGLFQELDINPLQVNNVSTKGCDFEGWTCYLVVNPIVFWSSKKKLVRFWRMDSGFGY